jgi:hypothetical protein
LPLDANRAHSEEESLCLGKAKSTRLPDEPRRCHATAITVGCPARDTTPQRRQVALALCFIDHADPGRGQRYRQEQAGALLPAVLHRLHQVSPLPTFDQLGTNVEANVID